MTFAAGTVMVVSDNFKIHQQAASRIYIN